MEDSEIDDNNNNSEKEDEEGKEAVGIEFTEQKADPENVIDLDGRIYQEKMRKTLLRLTWLRFTKASWWRTFSKKE